MKGFLYLLVVAFLLVSCRNANEDFVNQNDATLVSVPPQLTEMDKVNLKIDSLNHLYSDSLVITRGRGLGDGILHRVVDGVGAVIGSWVGKTVGSAVGTAMSNPVVAVGGYLVGR